LKAPELKCDILVSKFCFFKFNLYRYISDEATSALDSKNEATVGGLYKMHPVDP
jgi:hypothetical protein